MPDKDEDDTSGLGLDWLTSQLGDSAEHGDDKDADDSEDTAADADAADVGDGDVVDASPEGNGYAHEYAADDVEHHTVPAAPAQPMAFPWLKAQPEPIEDEPSQWAAAAIVESPAPPPPDLSPQPLLEWPVAPDERPVAPDERPVAPDERPVPPVARPVPPVVPGQIGMPSEGIAPPPGESLIEPPAWAGAGAWDEPVIEPEPTPPPAAGGFAWGLTPVSSVHDDDDDEHDENDEHETAVPSRSLAPNFGARVEAVDPIPDAAEARRGVDPRAMALPPVGPIVPVMPLGAPGPVAPIVPVAAEAPPTRLTPIASDSHDGTPTTLTPVAAEAPATRRTPVAPATPGWPFVPPTPVAPDVPADLIDDAPTTLTPVAPATPGWPFAAPTPAAPVAPADLIDDAPTSLTPVAPATPGWPFVPPTPPAPAAPIDTVDPIDQATTLMPVALEADGGHHSEADLEPEPWWTTPVQAPLVPTEAEAVAAGLPAPARPNPTPAAPSSSLSDSLFPFASSTPKASDPVSEAADTWPGGSVSSSRSGSGHEPPATRGGGSGRILFWSAGGLLAVVVLVALFFLGQRLVGAPTPAAAPTPSPTSTPTPTPSPAAEATGPQPVGVHGWDALGGGECVNPYTSPWEEKFTVVDCAAAHAAQLVYRGTFPGDATTAFPGEAALASQINLLCSAPGVFDMSATDDLPDLQVQGSYPVTAKQWKAPERHYYCFVSRSSAEPLTGSLAGPGPTPPAGP